MAKKKTVDKTPRENLADGTAIERLTRRVEGSDEREPYGSWRWTVYDPDRSPSRKSVNLRTQDKAGARRLATEYAKKRSLGTFDPWTQQIARGVKLNKAIDTFLEHQRAEGKSEATIKTDGDLLRRFEQHLPPGVVLSDIRAKDVRSFVNKPKPVPKKQQRPGVRGEQRSDSTKARMLATLHHFSGWALASDFAKTDFAEEVKPPKGKGRSERREVLKPEDEKLLLAALTTADSSEPDSRGWLCDWIVFGSRTGLRPSEQRHLRWDAVNFDDESVRIGVGHAVKTENSRRVVPVAGPALDVLRRRYEVRGDSPFVFTGQTGAQVGDYLGKALKRLARAAGLQKNVVPYSMRHGFGTRLAESGMPFYEIARLMGTSVKMIEDHYAHYSPGGAHARVRALMLGS